ncbi:hypothetical protein CBOM_07981 [Ceraceosorus bombacis]|uniref:Uncharacterized protein n=1 Tax=Ceraceosorus bombacis TaxID=401625 RepID=A0A0N7LBF0_9BASI|nr:hypothetical protein CBOM_07981 [Ceraceosorus bombacis]
MSTRSRAAHLQSSPKSYHPVLRYQFCRIYENNSSASVSRRGTDLPCLNPLGRSMWACNG